MRFRAILANPSPARSRVMRGIGANAAGQIGIVLVQLGTVPVLVTHWGVETYGVWLLLFTIPSYLGLGDFGLATAAGTAMTIETGRHNRAQAVGIFQSALLAILVISAVLMAVVVALAAFVPEGLLGRQGSVSVATLRAPFVLLSAYGIVSLMSGLVLAGFRCAQRYATGTATQSVVQLAEGAACIGVVSLGGSLAAVAAAYVIVRLLSIVIQTIMLRRMVPWLAIGVSGASLATIRSLVGPAMATVALSAAQVSTLLGTALTLGAATTAASVAVFTATRTLVRSGVQLTGIFNRAVMPEYSTAIGRDDSPAQDRMIAVTVGTSLALLVPLAIVLAAEGQAIVSLWTHGLVVPARSFLLTMIAVMLIGGVWSPVSNLIVAANRHASFAYVYLAVSIAALAASYPLAAWFQATGSAVSLLAVEIVMATFVAWIITTRDRSWNHGRVPTDPGKRAVGLRA